MTERVKPSTAIRCRSEREGEIQRIVLDGPPGNILDRSTLEAIRNRVREIVEEPGNSKLLVFEGAGAHFSYGASVEAHLPGEVAEMLFAFRALLVELEASRLPTAAVVRGQCLGGALELAAWCGKLICEPSARLGVPEIKLGVFPPIAALALPWRMTGAASTQLILSGAAVDGETAVRLGLADSCSADPEAEMEKWFAEELHPRSAVALRLAWQASRRPLAKLLREELPVLEDLYLRDLMSHRDPLEGLNSFLERRAPVWKNE